MDSDLVLNSTSEILGALFKQYDYKKQCPDVQGFILKYNITKCQLEVMKTR